MIIICNLFIPYSKTKLPFIIMTHLDVLVIVLEENQTAMGRVLASGRRPLRIHPPRMSITRIYVQRDTTVYVYYNDD